MSTLHPIIAVTGSSGAGTTTVMKSFTHIFRREKINAQKDKVHAKLAAFEKKNQWAFSATY